MSRTYKLVQLPYGYKGHQINEFDDDQADAAVLWLPDGTPPEVLMGVTEALQHSLQQGRRDRSEEILGDAGVTRAAAEVEKHEAELHPSGVSCSCGRFYDESCTPGRWELHFAYEILQAAARTP